MKTRNRQKAQKGVDYNGYQNTHLYNVVDQDLVQAHIIQFSYLNMRRFS